MKKVNLTAWLVALAATCAQSAEPGTNGNFFGNHTGQATPEGRSREGRDFLDLFGLGTGPQTDPYLAKTNAHCLNGDFSECFKSRALGSLDEFFNKEGYFLNDHVRVIRMPNVELRRLVDEPYEFSNEPRADEPEWDQFVKFLMRKVERFVKATALEVKVPEELTEEGRYSPRFVDEIADELDVIEDKKANIFTRYKLKKLFIPLLIVLKLFKLKLLLFLPMILGLASFKKLLGFLAIVVTGLIGYFKFCKTNSSGFGGGHAGYYQPEYSSSGVAHPPYYNHHNYREDYLDYTGYNRNAETGKALDTPAPAKHKPSGSVAFRDDQQSAATASQLAYGSS